MTVYHASYHLKGDGMYHNRSDGKHATLCGKFLARSIHDDLPYNALQMKDDNVIVCIALGEQQHFKEVNCEKCIAAYVKLKVEVKL